MRAAVAAGHPATAEAGVEILAEGGTAADAAVAAVLASCVAETVMTGLLGGAHAIVWDGRRARNLDCFVAVPGGTGPPMVDLQVPFGEETVHYAVGPASCAVPGLTAGLDVLWREHGRLPWARLVEPALRLAREGTALPGRHAACLAMLAPVMTLNRGAELYSPGGRLLQADERLRQPGLVAALEAVAREGAASVYRGTIAEALLAEPGVVITRDDLAVYEARWAEPVEVAYAGTRFLTRGGLSGVPELLARLPRLAGLSGADRVLALVDVLADEGVEGHTTNLCVCDGEGRAVVLTSSLGLGSGDFLPGARPAPEQHARGEGPARRRPRAWRAHAEHDGAVARRRRGRSRAGDRLGGRHAASDGAVHGGGRRARRGSRAAGGRRPAALPPGRRHDQRRTGRRRGGAGSGSRPRAAPSAAGRTSTTTSAVRASSPAGAPPPIPAATASQSTSR